MIKARLFRRKFFTSIWRHVMSMHLENLCEKFYEKASDKNRGRMYHELVKVVSEVLKAKLGRLRKIINNMQKGILNKKVKGFFDFLGQFLKKKKMKEFSEKFLQIFFKEQEIKEIPGPMFVQMCNVFLQKSQNQLLILNFLREFWEAFQEKIQKVFLENKYIGNYKKNRRNF